ncbi:MAG: ankyrin repeat domain-containing protein [Epsilonproteobacteria bacterium]|nr:ankyrin repeat domain-containing protein [Campylobacterota bacterium]
MFRKIVRSLTKQTDIGDNYGQRPEYSEDAANAFWGSSLSKISFLNPAERLFLLNIWMYIADLDDPNWHIFACSGDVDGIKQMSQEVFSSRGDKSSSGVNKCVGKLKNKSGIYQNIRGMTPLHSAALFSFDERAMNNANFLEVVDLLFSYGANIEAKMEETGYTPLHLLAMYGCNTKLVDRFLSENENILCVLDGQKNNVLHLSIEKNNVIMFSHFLKLMVKKGSLYSYMLQENAKSLAPLRLLDQKTANQYQPFYDVINGEPGAQDYRKLCGPKEEPK